ncbi:hypothetical protein QIH13_27580, partial [Klebsiella pneumoniae]|nr:hypothetical protein [Klebsiella pneumoniae]
APLGADDDNVSHFQTFSRNPQIRWCSSALQLGPLACEACHRITDARMGRKRQRLLTYVPDGVQIIDIPK